jgi:chaperonin cofactor prefoldin
MQQNNLADAKDTLSYNIMQVEKDFETKMSDFREKMMEVHIILQKKADDAIIRKWVGDLILTKTGELSEFLVNRMDRINAKVDRNHEEVIKMIN